MHSEPFLEKHVSIHTVKGKHFDFTGSSFPQIGGAQGFSIEVQYPIIGLAKDFGLKPCIGVETWNPTYELPFPLPNAEWPTQLSGANWKFLDADGVRYRIDRGIGSSIDSNLHEWIPSRGDNDFPSPLVVSETYRKTEPTSGNSRLGLFIESDQKELIIWRLH